MGLFRRRDTEERSQFPLTTLGQVASMAAAAIDGDGGLPAPTIERVLHHAAAWACVDVLSSTIRQLPVQSHRNQSDRRIPVPNPTIVDRPSPIVTRRVWLGQMVASLALDGNAFGWIDSGRVDRAGTPTSIELLDPTRIPKGRRTVVEGIPQVDITDGTAAGTHQLWPWGPIFHVPGKMVLPGSPFALSPVDYAGPALNAGLAAQEFVSRYFADGGHPTSILSSDDPELDEDMAKRIKASFVAATKPGSREPAVLGSGLTYSKIQADPSNTQFLDLIRFTVEQAARFWHVPPQMIYAAVSGQNVTYTNATVADLHYLKHSTEDYLTNIEEAWDGLVFGTVHSRFNRDAFLRADPKARAELHKLRLDTKTRTVNEVRAIEDEPAFADPAYDQPGIPGDDGGPVAEA